MKYLYIGGKYDLSPLNIMGKHGDIFVYADSRPRSKKGARFKFNIFGENEYACPEFLSNLFNVFNLNNFSYQHGPDEVVIDPFNVSQCLKFYNEVRDITIFYYINVVFPQQIERMKDIIFDTDALIVSSFIPDIDMLLKYIQIRDRKINYIQLNKSFPQQSIITESNEKYFDKFIYLNIMNIPSKMIKTYSTWNEFNSDINNY
jgi:hypothetical protein